MPTTDANPEIEIQLVWVSPDTVWSFFYEIDDVPNLTPSEEQGEAWEARVNNERVGMAVVDTLGTPFVSRIAVTPDTRREGVGTVILNRLQDEYSRLRCRVHKENSAGLGLVESTGFHRKQEGRYGELWWYDTQAEDSKRK